LRLFYHAGWGKPILEIGPGRLADLFLQEIAENPQAVFLVFVKSPKFLEPVEMGPAPVQLAGRFPIHPFEPGEKAHFFSLARGFSISELCLPNSLAIRSEVSISPSFLEKKIRRSHMAKESTTSSRKVFISGGKSISTDRSFRFSSLLYIRVTPQNPLLKVRKELRSPFDSNDSWGFFL